MVKAGEVQTRQWDGTLEAPSWWGWLAFVLSLLGFGEGLYLTIDHFTGTLPVCSASGLVNCAKVTTSAQSEIFGIPVALLGLLFYTGMLVVNVPPLWRVPSLIVVRLRLAMTVVGIGTVIWLLSAELFIIKAICLWCTGIHIVTFCLFVLVVSTYPVMAGRATLEE